ncbi:MAG: DUF4251 domain-containing protein [Rikenellaceae bacterium]
MTKKFLIFTLTTLFIFAMQNEASSQEEKTRKEIRKEKRANEENENKKATLKKLESLKFKLDVTELISSDQPGISNIKLRSNVWDVKVDNDVFHCFLPIRANNSPTIAWIEPQTFHIIASNYTMSIDDSEKNIKMVINTTDNSVNPYEFTFSVPPTGARGTLVTVKSDFWGPVSFRGELK